MPRHERKTREEDTGGRHKSVFMVRSGEFVSQQMVSLVHDHSFFLFYYFPKLLCLI